MKMCKSGDVSVLHNISQGRDLIPRKKMDKHVVETD